MKRYFVQFVAELLKPTGIYVTMVPGLLASHVGLTGRNHNYIQMDVSFS